MSNDAFFYIPGVLKKRYLPQQLEDGQQSGSQLSLDRPDHDLQYSPISEIEDSVQTVSSHVLFGFLFVVGFVCVGFLFFFCFFFGGGGGLGGIVGFFHLEH